MILLVEQFLGEQNATAAHRIQAKRKFGLYTQLLMEGG